MKADYPLKIDGEDSYGNIEIVADDAGGRIVARVVVDNCNSETAMKDAKRIVKAWNRHDDILEACQGALLALYLTLDQIDALCSELHLSPFPHPPTDEIEKIIKDAGGEVYRTAEEAMKARASQ